jgi:hypothetical protein
VQVSGEPAFAKAGQRNHKQVQRAKACSLSVQIFCFCITHFELNYCYPLPFVPSPFFAAAARQTAAAADRRSNAPTLQGQPTHPADLRKPLTNTAENKTAKEILKTKISDS